MRVVSILGCGWLGFPLALFLKGKGFEIKGSTTDLEKLKELSKNRIEPYLINFCPEIDYENVKGFFDTEVLIINFPPKRRDYIEDYHKSQISSVKDAILKSKLDKVIFISSTSVYPEVNSVVTEDEIMEPTKLSGKALVAVEKILMNTEGFRTTVLRLAGLIGYDRNPRAFLKKRKFIGKFNAPLNLVHRDDCVSIIHQIIDKDIWGETFNVCCDQHPYRKEFYESEAKISRIELPEFKDESKSKFKIVSNEKLKRVLGYNFKYPNPLDID